MSDTFTLDKAAIGDELEVVGVHAEGAPEDWEIWLEEIGFTAGEPCVVLQKAAPVSYTHLTLPTTHQV